MPDRRLPRPLANTFAPVNLLAPLLRGYRSALRLPGDVSEQPSRREPDVMSYF